MEEEKEVQRIINELIYNGYATFEIEKYNKKWLFKTLTLADREEILSISDACNEDVEAFDYSVQNYLLKFALLGVNGVEMSEEAKDKLFMKLPPKIILGLFKEYEKFDKLQTKAWENTSYIDKLVNEDFSRMKYLVMSHFNALPTEDRVKNMNDYQWLWCYKNYVKQRNEMYIEVLDALDYLGFYFNPELSREMKEARKRHEEDNGKETTKSTAKKGRVIMSADNTTQTIISDATVDEDFDKKLKLFISEEDPKTILDDDTQKGRATKFETKEDFLARAMSFQGDAEEIIRQRKEDAEKAGVKETDLDVIQIK